MEWLIFAAAIILGIFATAWLTQERLIFFPQPLSSTAHLPTRAEPLEVVAADGKRLHGWIAKGTTVPAPTVIYFGGNAEELAKALARLDAPQPQLPLEHSASPLTQQHELIRDSAVYGEFFDARVRSQYPGTTTPPPGEPEQ